MTDTEKRAYNLGLETAISVLRGGVHAASSNSGLWGIQDDDKIFIAAIQREKLKVADRGYGE